tara:strand:+ start:143 stop:622 length:480 start_codon:yes stop_codon:yes gene_type:complete
VPVGDSRRAVCFVATASKVLDMKSSWQSYGSKGNWMRVFSHVPVHFAILLGFSICLGGGGAGGGDTSRRLAAGFFAVGFFGGGAAGMRSSVAPLLMFVILKAGAFLAAGLREGHCGGAPPLLPPYMLCSQLKLCAPQLVRPQRWNTGKGAASTESGASS